MKHQLYDQSLALEIQNIKNTQLIVDGLEKGDIQIEGLTIDELHRVYKFYKFTIDQNTMRLKLLKNK